MDAALSPFYGGRADAFWLRKRPSSDQTLTTNRIPVLSVMIRAIRG